MTKTLYWAPRILGILAIVFISSFALDVFQEGTSFIQMLIALAMHLIPSALLAILLIIAWKYERVGGLLFIVISFVPFFFLNNNVWVNVMLGAPFLLTGILFFCNTHTHPSV